MYHARIFKSVVLLSVLSVFFSCDSRFEQTIPNNDSYSSTGISKIKIENYINRLFIDIIGRGPTDIEKSIEVDKLNENDLSKESRLDLINRLMTDETPSENEGSYLEAYCNNLYLLAKIRCLEGVSDTEIKSQKIFDLRTQVYNDSVAQNWDNYYKGLNEIKRYEWMFESAALLVSGEIKYHEIHAFVIDNGIYDELNMNSFNFILATFDQLLYRQPIEEEFDNAYDMVEFGMPNTLFGNTGNSKEDYISIIINSTAMKEGMIRWAYQVFLQRDGTAGEIATLLESYKINENINEVIAKIIVTDEYANFY